MASIGFEEKLWQAADKLRGSMDASEYKSVVLGLIFLKYVSDVILEAMNRTQFRSNESYSIKRQILCVFKCHTNRFQAKRS